ncbi:uncharacterized protein LOC142334689 isoform X2 [Convolutriloba macropyga]|uniref:uncharacterized protein LOC142334689 isoform X2 n=1 Tax=Convolutriloba macropyga TaxID=536237 RepID=UPI003F521F58
MSEDSAAGNSDVIRDSEIISHTDSIQDDSNLSTFTKMQYADIHNAYENLASKLTNTECAVQSLKLHLCNMQARQDLQDKKPLPQPTVTKAHDISFSPRRTTEVTGNNSLKQNELLDSEYKKVAKELDRLRGELQTALDSKQKISEENQSLKTQIEVNHAARLAETVRLEKLENAKTKSIKKLNEMRGQLDREVELRVSLEKSHSSLLTRLEDVELLMEQERAQVKELDSEYAALKRECLALRTEVEDERRLRMESEDALKGLRQEAETNGSKVGELLSERSLIDGALVQWKKDYLAMETELKEKTRLLEEQEEKVKSFKAQVEELQSSLRSTTEQSEKWQTEHEKEKEEMQRQFETALEKQREAVSPAAVDAERFKTRKLQEQIAELGCQMSDYERQHATDNAQLRDQMRQKDAEAKRARTECEELRRIQDKAMQDKEDLLTEVNKTVDQLSSQRLKLEYSLEETKLELAKAEQARNHQESENVRLLEEMSSMQIKQAATDQLQSTIVQMTQENQQLTHDAAKLKAKVSSLTEEMDSLGNTKSELSVTKRQNAAYEAQFTKMSSEINCLKVSLQKSEALVKQYREKFDSAQDENSVVRKLTDDVREMRAIKEELTMDVERLREENHNLKISLDSTSTQMTTKLALINDIEKKRLESAEMARRKEEETVRNYEEKLEVIHRQQTRERELVISKMKRDHTEMKKSRDEAVTRANESAQLVVELKARMEELHDDLSKQRDQTRTIKMSLDNSQRQKEVITDLNERVKMLSEQLSACEKEKKHYMKQNLEQVKSVSVFSTQISQLEGQLKSLSHLNEESASLAKKYENLAIAERQDRTNIEHKYSQLNSRCKELEKHLIDVTLNNNSFTRDPQNSAHNESYLQPAFNASRQHSPLTLRTERGGDDLLPIWSSRENSVCDEGEPASCDVAKESSHSRKGGNARREGGSSRHQKPIQHERVPREKDITCESTMTNEKARLMIQESKETMRKLSERMCLLEHNSSSPSFSSYS